MAKTLVPAGLASDPLYQYIAKACAMELLRGQPHTSRSPPSIQSPAYPALAGIPGVCLPSPDQGSGISSTMIVRFPKAGCQATWFSPFPGMNIRHCAVGTDSRPHHRTTRHRAEAPQQQLSTLGSPVRASFRELPSSHGVTATRMSDGGLRGKTRGAANVAMTPPKEAAPAVSLLRRRLANRRVHRPFSLAALRSKQPFPPPQSRPPRREERNRIGWHAAG